MITLILLHPFQSVPVQSWSFEKDDLIRIGRSTENQVVLYSAVVSRRHIELRRRGTRWEIINLGTNGTYYNGKPITKMLVEDGMTVHLARSGPKISIRLGKKVVEELQKIAAEETLTQTVNAPQSLSDTVAEEELTAETAINRPSEIPPSTQISE